MKSFFSILVTNFECLLTSVFFPEFQNSGKISHFSDFLIDETSFHTFYTLSNDDGVVSHHHFLFRKF